MPDAAAYYALEKLALAVDALVTGAGRVQERLQAAAIELSPASVTGKTAAGLRTALGTPWSPVAVANIIKRSAETP